MAQKNLTDSRVFPAWALTDQATGDKLEVRQRLTVK